MSNLLAPDIYIQTPRLALRAFVPSDAKEVLAFDSHPLVQQYTGDRLISTEEEALANITRLIHGDYQKYGYGRWAAVHKKDERVIGFAGLKYLRYYDTTDIGFRFLPEYWNQGLATEASIALLQYGFDYLKLMEIVGIAHPDNVASCKVLQKVGLQFDKTEDYEGDGGSYNWYRITSEEYASRNAAPKEVDGK